MNKKKVNRILFITSISMLLAAGFLTEIIGIEQFDILGYAGAILFIATVVKRKLRR